MTKLFLNLALISTCFTQAYFGQGVTTGYFNQGADVKKRQIQLQRLRTKESPVEKDVLSSSKSLWNNPCIKSWRQDVYGTYCKYKAIASSLRRHRVATSAPQTFTITTSTKLVIEQGDITKSKTEAIVNAANEMLRGGGGVCGAIFHAAGWNKLQSACNKYDEVNYVRCPVGQAKLTESFQLKENGINHIIHAVGPNCNIIKDEELQNKLLYQAYTNSLNLAAENGITSVTFPFISSAIYAFPRERAAKIALQATRDFAKKNSKVKSINFALFSKDDQSLFLKYQNEHKR